MHVLPQDIEALLVQDASGPYKEPAPYALMVAMVYLVQPRISDPRKRHSITQWISWILPVLGLLGLVMYL